MDKRAILALVLMSLVMLVWMIFIAPKTPKPAVQPSQQENVTSSAPSTEAVSGPQEEMQEPSEPSPARLTQLADAPRIQIQTPLYTAEVIESTGTIAQWTLHHYKKRNGGQNDGVELIPVAEDNPRLGSRCLEISSRSIRGLETATWTLEQPQDNVLRFRTQLGNLELVKEVVFHQDQYLADITIQLRNLADHPQPVDYHLHWGPGIPDDMPKPNRKKTGPVVYLRGAPSDQPIRDVQEESTTGEAIWAGLQSKYFAAILIPDPSIRAWYRRLGKPGEPLPYIAAPDYEIVLENKELTLGPNGEADATLVHHYRLYAGPKLARTLKAITFPPDSQQPVVGLTKLNSLGVWGLADVMLWLLNHFYTVAKNYGIAILLLTTIIKLILYPLTQMSYRSTKKMQQLQPLINEIRQKYRDDPQRMNKAMMRLYKEHGINPMGGCLPMIPQMPIFFALFYAVRDAAEMRSAGFLWIRDLSLPDTIYQLGGFGINLLPLLMGVSMFWQQHMAGTGATDPGQARFMKYLPLLFTFLFYNMPSGLVLYWFWNNALTIAQQYLINRTYRFEVPIQPEPKKKSPKSPTRKRG